MAGRPLCLTPLSPVCGGVSCTEFTHRAPTCRFCCHHTSRTPPCELSYVSCAFTPPPSLQVVLCCVQPTFRVVVTLSLAEASELVWAARQLYVLTPTTIYVAFIALPTGEMSLGILVWEVWEVWEAHGSTLCISPYLPVR